ncbi:MAG: hypothetical protein IT378_25255, partial [Sandaracinaceae bacterium]|nr:hypothetical protein [Sandaracinaceae bacterium]
TPIDSAMRFGLMLWPSAAGGCRSVADYVASPAAPFTNPQCLGPELAVPVALGTSAAIQGAIDTGTTPLCESTPLVQALRGVRGALPVLAPGELRRQYVVLVTDGYEASSFCDAGQSTSALQEIQALARDGIRTVVVSLEPSVDTTGIGARLNDFACAGLEAPDFDASCAGDAASGYSARPDVGRRLYNDASDSTSLVTHLRDLVTNASCSDRVILI